MRALKTGRARRHTNLALVQQYGSNAWRIHNYLTEATAKDIEKALEELRALTTDVNRDRKNLQASTPFAVRSRERGREVLTCHACFFSSVFSRCRRGSGRS